MTQKVASVSAVDEVLTVDSIIDWQLPLLAILFVAVIFTAIKTVAHRHEARSQFMQLQKLEKERDILAAQWSRLKLEQGTMLNQVRVERMARWDLKMQMPNISEVIIVNEKILEDTLPVMRSILDSTLALGD